MSTKKPLDHKPDSIAAADKRRREGKDRPEARQREARKSDSSTAGQLKSHPAGAMAGAAAGAAAGAVSGIAAGPVGSLAGAVVGGVTGAVLGSHASSAAAGVPVQPGSIDREAAAAAPSIQPPEPTTSPDEKPFERE